MVEYQQGQAKEPSQGVFFLLRKLEKVRGDRVEHLKPAHSV